MKHQRNSLKSPVTATRKFSSSAVPHPPTNINNNNGSRPRRPTQPENRRRASSTPSAGASNAARRDKSPIFWGATDDAPLYSGPLGEFVGSVERGTVILEASRYRDVFGGWWISTRCADGSFGWVEFNKGRNLADSVAGCSAASLWKRVYDARATPSPSLTSPDKAANAATSPSGAGIPDPNVDLSLAFPQVSVDAIAELESKHFLFQDASLFQYYWDSVFTAGKHRDWNGEYQQALEEYRMMPHLSFLSSDNRESSIAAKAKLTQILEEFRQDVVAAVMEVCAEAVIPFAQRRLCSLPEHTNEVFFVNGLLIRRCVDTADGDLGGDELAAKLGNAMYRNNEILAVEACSHFLYTPLQARCTFGGHAFLCSTIPPYGNANLIHANSCFSSTTKTHGDGDADRAAAVEPVPLVHDLLRSVGNALHFQNDEVPLEWRVYAGRDRRLYLSHTTRLLPPVLPLVKERSKGIHSSEPSSAIEARNFMHENGETKLDVRLYPSIARCRIRPEVFFNWPTAWSVNECCLVEDETGQKHQQYRPNAAELKQAASNSSSCAVGRWIQNDGITQVAGIIGFYLPLSGVTMPVTTCNTCESTIDANEIRFVVCADPSHCCHVCAGCYSRLVLVSGEGKDGVAQNTAEPLSRTFAEAVRCGACCRNAGCAILEPSISTIVHAHGLNLRYLPYVLHRLPLSTRPAVEHFIHVELVTRAAKYVLQQDLCRATTATEARSVCETVFTALLQPTGTVSEHFWRARLGPMLQLHFDGICEPFQVSVHALRAVAERAQSLTGVWLSNASLASLDALSASPKSKASITNEESEKVGKGKTDKGPASAVSDNDVAQPFVEIEAITPRTWVFPVAPLHNAHVPATSDTNRTEDDPTPPLRCRLESILLFWIGFTPENADDRQQPFYLEDSMLRSTS